MAVDKKPGHRVDTNKVIKESGELVAYIPLTQETGLGVQVLQEPDASNANTMRIRVPFYVGGSVTRAPGISRKIVFPKEALPGLVQEGNAQIAQGNQPLTVYARHSHAASSSHLPIGAVRELQQEDSVGYAVLEVAPTQPDGANVQMLVNENMINAVSLRTGRFNLGDAKVQGERVYVFQEGSKLDGIDFAPDGPAQPTYGIEILNEEVRVEPLSVKSTRRRKLSEEITLEDVPTDVRETIERPIRAQVEKLTQERDALVAERNLRDRDEYLREIASKTKEPEAGFKVMQDLCNEKKALDRASASTAVTPFLLQALEAATTSKQPEKTKEELVQELFVTRTAAGSAVIQEPTAPVEPTISQEERSYLGTADGLLAPEF